MRVHDVVIVGGGPAGMTAAHALHDRDILLLEKSDRFGGRILSLPRGQHWINLGAHLFAGAESRMGRLASELRLKMIGIPGDMSAIALDRDIFSRIKPSRLPWALPLGLRERFDLYRVGMKIFRRVGKRRQQGRSLPGETEAQRRARVAELYSDETFREMIGIPRERVDAILRTAARRAASDIDVMSAGVGVSLFSVVWSGQKSVLANNLAGGSGVLPAAFAEHIGARGVLNASVEGIRQVDDLVEVDFVERGESRRVRARQAIIAVPAPIALQLVRDIPAGVARALGQMTYGPFLCVGVLSDFSDSLPIDDIYALMTPGRSFDMLMNHSNTMREISTEPPSSILLYSGGSRAEEQMKLPDEEIRERFLEEMYDILPMLRGRLTEAIVMRWEIGNVYRRPTVDFEPMLRYCERGDTLIHYCGDYFAELGNMEVAAASAEEAALRAKMALLTI